MAGVDMGENVGDGLLLEAMNACLASAGDLVGVLKEESEVIKAFDAERLLPLLSRKEFLAGDLSRRMEALRGYRERREKEKGAGSPLLVGECEARLRELLREIDRLNAFNRVFIEHSLDHWRKMTAGMELPIYGPSSNRAGGGVRGKGFHFRGEA